MINVADDLFIALAAVHLAATWFLAGLIWTIQVVHYPSFDSIDQQRYTSFQAAHMTKMGSLVGPPWLIEGLTVLALFLTAPSNAILVLTIFGGLLELVVIAVTLRSSIPAHEALTAGFDRTAHTRLLSTNWIRTWAWTLRGVIAVTILVLAF